MNPSRRIQALGVSPIRHLAPLARKAEERGIRVLPLNIGQPDLPTPRAYYEAIRSFDAPYTPYAPSQGLPELLEAIREDFRVRGVALDPESILVTAGGSEALLFSLLTLCDPGDEVLVAEPFYTNYNFFADTAGVKLVSVRTDPEEGYALPPDADLEARLSSRTRAVLVTNPNNPTGTVLPREDMERLGRFAARHDLFVLADEVLDGDDYLLRHKTTARSRYDAVLASLAATPEVFDAVFFNTRGEVCEGARSNVYIERDGMLLTPPVSSGLLPGVMRRHLLESGRAVECVLYREDLLTAPAVFLSNALRGLFPVTLRSSPVSQLR